MASALVGAMHAHHRGVAARTLHRVGHHAVVILLPDPAPRGHDRASASSVSQRLEHGLRVSSISGRTARGLRGAHRAAHRPAPRRTAALTGISATTSPLCLTHQAVGVGGHADDGEIQFPFLKMRSASASRPGFSTASMRSWLFRQQHLIGGHVGFALRHLVEIEFDAAAALVAPFRPTTRSAPPRPCPGWR